eukprot:89164-Prymnesium_polylepis.2
MQKVTLRAKSIHMRDFTIKQRLDCHAQRLEISMHIPGSPIDSTGLKRDSEIRSMAAHGAKDGTKTRATHGPRARAVRNLRHAYAPWSPAHQPCWSRRARECRNES